MRQAPRADRRGTSTSASRISHKVYSGSAGSQGLTKKALRPPAEEALGHGALPIGVRQVDHDDPGRLGLQIVRHRRTHPARQRGIDDQRVELWQLVAEAQGRVAINSLDDVVVAGAQVVGQAAPVRAIGLDQANELGLGASIGMRTLSVDRSSPLFGTCWVSPPGALLCLGDDAAAGVDAPGVEPVAGAIISDEAYPQRAVGPFDGNLHLDLSPGACPNLGKGKHVPVVATARAILVGRKATRAPVQMAQGPASGNPQDSVAHAQRTGVGHHHEGGRPVGREQHG